MIARVIALALHHRAMIVLLTIAIVGAGIFAMRDTRLDAIPDLSDVQVIVTTEVPGQHPQVVDDQVTYPLSIAMLSVPGATVVRGFSMFEQSFVYVLFEDGTDLYWARSRVLEALAVVRDRLPAGVLPKLGPDATGVGWVYQYVLLAGWYSPEFPDGLWYDEANDRHYASLEVMPEARRATARRVRAFDRPGVCPLSGRPLVSAELDLMQLRSLQDFRLRYALNAIEGVAEVASIGGFVKQYQVVLDPVRLFAFRMGTSDVIAAIERSNTDVGGSVVELGENEYMVRSRGYLRGVADLERIPVALPAEGGTPILLRDVADVNVGGETRRGIGDFQAGTRHEAVHHGSPIANAGSLGEAVGGVVIARVDANALEVIRAVKARIGELEEGLPPGVRIVATYDRSQLIERTVETLEHTLVEEIIVVGIVCIMFLLHARSELVAVFVVPASVVVAILVMNLLGITANVMSLGGIAISIGVVVDSAIIMVENAHKHLDHEDDRVRAGLPPTPRIRIIEAAAAEVGPQLFFSLLVITVSFLPVFVLGGEAGRLFRPLAFTKTFAMAAAAVLSITIVPVLMLQFITARVLPVAWGWRRNLVITCAAMIGPAVVVFVIAAWVPALVPYRLEIALGGAVLAGMLLVPQRIIHEDESPVSRVLERIYEPVFAAAMRHPWLVLVLVLAALASTIVPATRLGREFMPSLDEGDLFYMPTTDPSIGITTSKQLLAATDRLIASVPEVVTVHGKIGRAETATDPAPLSMLETVIQLEPDRHKWRRRTIRRFYSDWPAPIAGLLARVLPDARPITTSELKFGWTDADGTTHAGLNEIVDLPGVANAWPYPIESRIDMLATGIKTPVGIKIFGPDLAVLGELAERVAASVRAIDGTRSAYPERTLGGRYLDVEIDDAAAARYGLRREDIQDVIRTAVGGMNVTTTVEGIERYPLNVRYARELRDDVEALREVLVRAEPELLVPLGQVADFRITPGPPMIRSENGERTAWVYVDVEGRDLGSYVAEARRAVDEAIDLPSGYSLRFAGQFEAWERTLPRLVAAGSLTLVIIVVLLYASSGSWFRVAFVLLAVPFSMIGALWFLYALGYHLSLAVVIGMIALAGLDAETGMVMLLYLDTSLARAQAAGNLETRADLSRAVHEGAVKRIRPKAMTVAATFIGLVPLLWAEGSGADVMRRIAAPMIGGLVISFAMELVVYPVVFWLVAVRRLPRVSEGS